MKFFGHAAIAALALAVPAIGQPQTINAIKLDAAPKIDGAIDDACWQRAADTTEFWFRDTGVLGSEPTSAWICYDSNYIYVAYDCKDSQPDKIIADQVKRNGSFGSDDFVKLEIDPWHTHRNTFIYYVTPRGTQFDILPGVGGTKVEWTGDWLGAAKRNDKGWTAEMAIPWSMLKYPKGQSTMSVAFTRRQARSDQSWTSPNLGPGYSLPLMFDLAGLNPPAPPLQRIILDYTNFALGGVAFKSGLDVKQQLSQQTNSLLTVNPDFESVEQSLESIDFTYTPRVLSDNRPFFGEGTEPSEDDYRVFYSRNVEKVDIGGKITGQKGLNNFQGLITTTRDQDYHFYGKSRWDFGTNSSIGATLANMGLTGLHNSAGALVAKLGRKNDKRSDALYTKLFKSSTSGSGGDGAIKVFGGAGSGGSGQVGWRLYYQDVGPDYYAADGILTDPDLKGWNYRLDYGFNYDSGLVRGWWIQAGGNNWDLHSGDPLSDMINFDLKAWTLKNDVHFNVTRNDRRAQTADGEDFTIYNDLIYSLGFGWNENNAMKQGMIEVGFGRRAGGHSVHTQVEQTLKLSSKLSTNLSLELLRMTGPFARHERQSIASFSYDITPERSLSARLLEETGKVNLTFGFRQAVRRGEDLYLLFGDPNANATKMRVILKVIKPL